MSPQQLLSHQDAGTFWPADHDVAADGDLDLAYASALAQRALREARGERVAGYKLGWTNRAAWPGMGVDAPMWGTLHETTVVHCDGPRELGLRWGTLPRLEPEVVMGLRAVPAPAAGLDELFDAVDWLAPAFEVVQSHLPGWNYTPAPTLSDGAVHARLVVGRRTPARALAASGHELARRLAAARVRVEAGGAPRGEGRGDLVLGSPLEALRVFVGQHARRAGVPALRAGELVSTGTWTAAFEPAPGERWRATFDGGLAPLEVTWR